MNMLLTIFITSGMGIVAMLLLKRYQDSRAILMFWPRLRSSVEVKLRSVERSVKKAQHISSKTFYVLLHRFLIAGRRIASDMEKKLDHKSRNLLSLIRGRQELQRRGKASIFLHDMTNFRNHFRKE